MTSNSAPLPAAAWPNDWPVVRLKSPDGASAVVSLWGGQVLSWCTPNGAERLFLSPQAVFDGKTAIRGGVPVIFPQFNQRGDLPRHGFARNRAWQCETERQGEDYALATFVLRDDDDTRAIWPHRFRLELTVCISGDRLDLEVEMENTGDTTWSAHAALHSYFRVLDIEACSLDGLSDHDYEDMLDGGAVKHQRLLNVLFDDACDRVYRGIKRPLLLRNDDDNLGLFQAGFQDLVVWNPWEGAGIPDLSDPAFKQFLCLEAAQVTDRVLLEPGASWTGRQSCATLGARHE